MMNETYTHSRHITKGLLDTVKVGDLVRVNNWKRPFRVVGVTENYFMMAQKFFWKLAVFSLRKEAVARHSIQCDARWDVSLRTRPYDIWLY